MHEQLINNSIGALLAAIEIYNKPNFRYRNEIFSILVINAWELLLKAKILSDNDNDVKSIYVFDSQGNIKTNRNNTPLTVELIGAINELQLHDTLRENLLTLLEVRDNAIHFFNKPQLDYVVFSLGTAAIKNYQKLASEWFGRKLSQHNFYILPIGFMHPFKTFTLAELDMEPEIIQNLLANVALNQEKKSEGGFHFTCEIEIVLKSAKKVSDSTNLTVSVDPSASNAVAIVKTQKLTDKYTLSYDEVFKKIKKDLPYIKQSDFNRFIREKKIKEDDKYSAYNFRYQRHEEEFRKSGKVSVGTPSIYNEEFVRYLANELPSYVKQ